MSRVSITERAGLAAAICGCALMVAVGCADKRDYADDSVITTVTPAPTTNPADTTPVGAVWSVPQAFLGTWTGLATDGPVSVDVTLTIDPGKNSEELVNSSNTNKATGDRCDFVERVITITPTELTLAARPTGGRDCPGNGRPSTVQLAPDGSLTYTAGSTLTGTLHRT